MEPTAHELALTLDAANVEKVDPDLYAQETVTCRFRGVDLKISTFLDSAERDQWLGVEQDNLVVVGPTWIAAPAFDRVVGEIAERLDGEIR